MSEPPIEIRPAHITDLKDIVNLLNDDELGGQREDISKSSMPEYRRAYERITQDPNNDLLVATLDTDVIGCLQITLKQSLSYKGSLRCIVEDVRVAKNYRANGVGKLLMQAVENYAKNSGCNIIELFVHTLRPNAQRFYESLGFEGNHRGFRKIIHLDNG